MRFSLNHSAIWLVDHCHCQPIGWNGEISCKAVGQSHRWYDGLLVFPNPRGTVLPQHWSLALSNLGIATEKDTEIEIPEQSTIYTLIPLLSETLHPQHLCWISAFSIPTFNTQINTDASVIIKGEDLSIQ